MFTMDIDLEEDEELLKHQNTKIQFYHFHPYKSLDWDYLDFKEDLSWIKKI